MKKKIKNLLLSLGFCAFSLCVGMLAFGMTASAYVDPSVMTYMIQVVAGVVVAIGAVVGVYWRRAKKKVQDKLGIEEKKEYESDDIVVDDL